ncbi:hypothetical protein [Nocardioides cynanchi]|uniref:hypothetical protein n=1 Tax=Nocardioides cynanchi TaxID=2558918 RepID=UPI0012475194|nr:hypothetical protein [Nocardioides cynanchi]
MTPGGAARIVERRDETALVDLLREADAEFEDEAFEGALSASLRATPSLVDKWNMWSGDQRWTPSAAVDGVNTAWILVGGTPVHQRVHEDAAAAVADFIHRMAAWLARREVLVFDE